MKNSEADDEEVTASVTRLAPLIPPAPPDDNAQHKGAEHEGNCSTPHCRREGAPPS